MTINVSFRRRGRQQRVVRLTLAVSLVLALSLVLNGAAMAQRADCVMLNKGPHLVEGIAYLRDILARMDRHHVKKFSRFTPLTAWS